MTNEIKYVRNEHRLHTLADPEPGAPEHAKRRIANTQDCKTINRAKAEVRTRKIGAQTRSQGQVALEYGR